MQAKRGKIAAAPVLAATVILGTSGVATAATPVKAVKSAQLTPLKIAYASVGAQYSDLFVGVNDGIFKKYGLDVQITQVTPATLVAGILSGTVNLGAGVADTTASAILSGEQLEFVALSMGVYNIQIWADASIKTIAQLKGTSMGLTTQGGETDFALTDFSQRNNLGTSVTRKYLVTTAAVLSAMESGAIQSGMLSPPNGQALLNAGDHVLTTLTNLPYAVGSYEGTSAWINAHKKTVNAFYKAEAANLKYLHTPKHAANVENLIAKYNPGTSQSDAVIAYKFFQKVWKTDPSVNTSLIQQAFQRSATTAKVSPPTSVAKYIFKP